MMPDDFFDDETQKPLGENRIELRLLRQETQPAYLLGFPLGIRRRKLILRLEFADLLGALESLRKKVNQRGIKVVNAVTESLQLFSGERMGIRFFFSRRAVGVPIKFRHKGIPT